MTGRRTAVVLALGAVGALLWAERRRPLRNPVEPGPTRLARNLAVGALTAATVAAIERPIVTRLSRLVEERNWGLAARLSLPRSLRTAAAVLLMDYTLYGWHVLLHRVPALWRLHEPHHIDRDLDTSTGVRFHFTEFLVSVPWRCAQIVMIGVSPRALALWQKLTFAEVLFHHSNLRLPIALERRLSDIVVTPRMHGIHHSILRSERDSNFSSGLSVWDRLHGTSRSGLAREHVVIGMPEHQRASAVTLFKTLVLPFRDSGTGNKRAPRRVVKVQSSVD